MTDYVTVSADAPQGRTGAIKLWGREAFDGMHKAGRLAAETLDMLVPHMVPGVTTAEIDRLIHQFILERGGVPATLGYRGYTHSTCISINHVVCHGIPSEKTLKSGDIVNVDVTPIVDGWHGDTSRMYLIGDVPLKARKLVEVTYECLMLGIEQARPGNHMGDVAHAIQRHAEKHRYGVVRDFAAMDWACCSMTPRSRPCRPPRHRARVEARHDLHHRADDQYRTPRCEAARRWLDGGDARPLAVGAVRAFDRHH